MRERERETNLCDACICSCNGGKLGYHLFFHIRSRVDKQENHSGDKQQMALWTLMQKNPHHHHKSDMSFLTRQEKTPFFIHTQRVQNLIIQDKVQGFLLEREWCGRRM